jgi:hypothetical protein
MSRLRPPGCVSGRRLVGGGAALVGLASLQLALPVAALAHQLNARFESPIPLVDYLAGAALAVAISFVVVLSGLGEGRLARVGGETDPDPASLGGMAVGGTAVGGRVENGREVPTLLRAGFRAIGLLAWLWIVVQELVVGGSSGADVSSLFLWVYGWVGLAIASALVAPLWSWLNPFATLFDLGAWLVRRAGITPWEPAPYPQALGRWPAVVGYLFFVWLELVVTLGSGGPILAWSMVGYTAVTLLLMAQFGRNVWLTSGEVFSVWFDLLNRLALIAPADWPDARRIRRRPALAGLGEGGWTMPDLILIVLAVAAVLYDGLSQTRLWRDLFGLPAVPMATLILFAWLGLLVTVAVLVSRLVGTPALAAGLLPIAVGYIVAHYLTFLLTDGQRIAIALSDPFQQGWDLLGTAFLQPTLPLSGAAVWGIQLGAVVGGHLVGAWSGHATAARTGLPQLRLRQVPLAALMVALTVTTLWSLGQEVVAPPQNAGALGPRTAAPASVVAMAGGSWPVLPPAPAAVGTTAHRPTGPRGG